jgi:hypothetical protein
MEGFEMQRRRFLGLLTSVLLAGNAGSQAQAAIRKKFLFKVKTKSGSIVGNILIEAKDVFAAIVKVKKRYPSCTILEAKEK